MSKKKNIGFHYWQPNIEGIIAYVDVPGTATVSRVTLTLDIVLSTSRFGLNRVIQPHIRNIRQYGSITIEFAVFSRLEPPLLSFYENPLHLPQIPISAEPGRENPTV
jgi:hypothetical protein